MLLPRLAGTAAPVGGAAAVLALSSQLALPVGPVPITLQSLAVVLVGAVLGPARGAGAVVLWLVLAALGAPLLAGGEGGAGKFVGPRAGFLFAFPIAAALAGLLVRHGRADGFGRATVMALAAHGVCLGGGAAWLARAVGVETAWAVGVLPFLPGAAAKSLAAAAVIAWLNRRGCASTSAGRAGWANR